MQTINSHSRSATNEVIVVLSAQVGPGNNERGHRMAIIRMRP
jgi:hypothetical protein